jgi:hypothetical protein
VRGFQDLIGRLERQGMHEAANHLTQAESALERSAWESANAQVRSGLESLFDSVALIRLGSSDTGGHARQALQDAGLLGSREAGLIREFMALAGEAGSHAGRSNGDSSTGRFLAGIGIAYMAVALIPELVRVEDVLLDQLDPPRGSSLPTDREIHTSCPTCGATQTLAEASLMRSGGDTIYTCKNACQPIVVVGEPGESPWPGRGYRLGSYVIRNARDLFLPIKSGAEVLLPASKAALMKERPVGS